MGAFAVSLFLLGIEGMSRRRVREDQRRAQARLVSAWVIPPEVSEEDREAKRTVQDGAVEIIVRNASDEPIYKVNVQTGVPVIVERELASDYYSRLIREHAIPEFSIISSDGDLHSGIMEIHGDVYMIAPRTEERLLAATSYVGSTYALEIWRLPRLVLLAEVSFMDAAGRTWRRDGDGALAPEVIRFPDEHGRVWRRSPGGKLREERWLRNRVSSLVSPFPWPWTRDRRHAQRYLERRRREEAREERWTKME